jgi:predicted dithiol-disulfide oxidoreductase (DUF899 family)
MMLRENPRVNAIRTRLAQVRAELHEALAETVRGEVKAYSFATVNGPTTLTSMFGKKHDLFVIHNMGVACPSCTMWADGFSGLYPHIADRASFVVVSPDAPAKQAEFAKSRGWRFPMASDTEKRFFADMGFLGPKGEAQPGVSAFQKDASKIVRVSADGFQPNDDFCPAWHLFELLPEGAGGWRPKFNYG